MPPAAPRSRKPAARTPRAQEARHDVDARAVHVLRKFRLIFNTIRTHFREVEGKTGVAGAQVWALAVLAEQPGIGVNALARALDIQQSTASNLLKPLIEAGFVASERGETDRRALALTITPAGLRVLKKAPAPITGVLPDVLSQLDAALLRRLDADLGAVIHLLHARKSDARKPLGSRD
jgi:DNA-binding MarR family transcriptional regulator